MIYTGAIRFDDKSFPLYYWIKTKNGIVFDFKTEKWIGVKSDKVEYIGEVQISKEGFMEPLKGLKLSWYARTYAGYGEEVYGNSEDEVLEKIIKNINNDKITEKRPVSLVYAKMKSKSKDKGFIL